MGNAGDVKDGVVLLQGVEAGVIAERAFGAQFVQLARSLRGRSPRAPALPDPRFRISPVRPAAGGESRRSGTPQLRAARARSRKRWSRDRCRWLPRLRARSLLCGRIDGGHGEIALVAAGRLRHGRTRAARHLRARRRRSPQPLTQCSAAPSGAASACRWFGRRTPACDTCPCCACRCAGSRVITQGRVMKRPPSSGQHLQHGKVQDAEIFAADDLLAGRVFGGDGFGEKSAHIGEHGQHLQLLEEAFRGFDFEQGAQAAGDLVQRA